MYRSNTEEDDSEGYIEADSGGSIVTVDMLK
jgi:hypothetical protein